MAGKTYNNIITESEVSLGITGLLVAPKSTVWTIARVDISSPPSASWYNVGAVVDDTPTLTLQREKFELVTGIPRVVQYQQVMALRGSYRVMLHSKDWTKMVYALGNTAADTTNWPTTPVTTSYVVQHYGTRQLQEYVALAVTDFIDGTQLVQHMYRCKVSDELEEMYRPDQEGRVPINFDLLAQITTIGTIPELTVGRRVQFGPDGSGV